MTHLFDSTLFETMEKTSNKQTEENTQELSTGDGNVAKYEQDAKVEPSYHPFPSDEMELNPNPIAIKDKNHDVGLVENVSKSEDQILKFRNNTSPGINPANQNQVLAVMLETIPKTEPEILSDDKAPSPNDSDDDLYNIDTNSDSDSNSDPELDPFADINCDPSFSSKPRSQNVNDSATTSHNDVTHSFEIETSILPSATTTTNTLKQQQLPSSQRKRLDSKLQCQLCLDKHSSESKLQMHVTICTTCHKNRHRFCVPCNELLCSRRMYRQHALTRHGIHVAKCRRGASSQCQFCPRFFASKDSLIVHLASHPEIKTSASASDKERLHLKPYECQDCNSTFRYYSTLSTHMKSHKDERDFQCPEPNCEKAFKLNANLKEHLKRMHSEVKPVKCEEPDCGKTFKLGNALRKHMVCHSEERPFSCSQPDCGKTFKNKERLTKHSKAHSGARRYSHITEGPFKCKECDRAFCKNWHLNKHLRTHIKKETDFFKCPQPNCETTFKHKHSMKTHIANIHTNKGVLPFQCPEPDCEKAFKTNGNLKEHLKGVHSEVKPFKCGDLNCGKTFKLADQLRKHMVCHSEDRPFSCALLDCGKKFKSKESLAKHLQAHSGARRYRHIKERPFKCEQCDRGFCKNWHLNKHLRTHSKKETYFLKCPEPN